MNILCNLLCFLASIAIASGAKLFHDNYHNNWAVLVAGSSGIWNYRHQADVAHAYQVLLSKKFDPSKIIVMMYDDIANNEENPFPGKLFNNYSHIDVYAGLKIDYRENDVTPTMFTKIMEGDASLKASGRKVLESKEDDHVFVYFTDHGGPNLIVFPGDFLLYDKDLHEIIKVMGEKKMFKQLVIYIEACESGSMFEGYEMPENVYAITAANGREPSWAAYCDDEEVHYCLGDLFSVNWIHDTESHSLSKETLETQFETVRNLTTSSHVKQFGSVKIANETLIEFLGKEKSSSDSEVAETKPREGAEDLMDSREAHLAPHYWRLRNSNDPEVIKKSLNAIRKDKELQSNVEKTYLKVIEKALEKSGKNEMLYQFVMKKHSEIPSSPCYRDLVNTFSQKCYSIGKYSAVAKYAYRLKNLCHITPLEMDELISIIGGLC